MNDVPAIFFEGVVFQITHEGTVLAGRDLSGCIGYVASEVYAKRCRYCMLLRNGRLKKVSYLNCEDQELDIETLSRKHLRYTGVVISADVDEYCTDPAATQRVLSATKGKHVLLSLRTPNISEEIAKCVGAIPFVFDLQLRTKITSDILKTMRALVEKNTLNKMLIDKDVEIEAETIQLLVDLLKQNQFFKMFFYGKCIAALKEIIASWKENSKEMVGKMIYFQEEFSDLQLSSTEFPFEESTEEEKRDGKLAYPAAWPDITRKLVLRNWDGSAVYWFLRPSVELESIFLFA